jgi:uncharacterized protein (DUF58 family)
MAAESKEMQKDSPWKNAIWFVVAGVFIAAAFVVQAPYVAYAVYAFGLLVAVAWASSRAWVAGLEAERSVDRTVVQQGESVDVRLTVTNHRGWPIPWVYVEDLLPPGFPIQGAHRRLAVLMPGRSLDFHYELTCPRRGYHRIGPVLMESGDLFGLQRRFRTGRQRAYVSVLPTVAYIETFNVAARRPQGPVKVSNRVYEDPTRITGLREYVPGDPMSRIHWKASARTGELFVKQNEPANVLGATLLLDLHDDSYVPEEKDERIELAITTTASIAYLLQMSGEQVGMVTNARDAAEVARYEGRAAEALSREEADAAAADEDEGTRISPLSVPTRRSPVQAVQIAENLARVLPGDGLDAEALALAAAPRLPRDAALLPVVPQVTERLALILGEMKLNGFSVSVFLIKNSRHHEEAAQLLAPHHINLFHIEHERHLHELSPQRIGR